jgi:hypothetical protein
MPTAQEVLGFSNRWYAEAIREAQAVVLDGGINVRVVTPPFFLATKLEAFYGRGHGDFVTSHDMEDIIALVDGRPEIVDDVRSVSNPDLRGYLRDEFSKLLASEAFIACIPGHLPPSDRGQARGNAVFARLSAIANG